MSALFPLGQIVATPGALAAFERAKQPPTCFLARHAIGDWGELEPTDVAENKYSLIHGFRLLSSYQTDAGEKSVECLHVGIQGTGADSAIQGDSQAGRVLGIQIFPVVLTRRRCQLDRRPRALRLHRNQASPAAACAVRQSLTSSLCASLSPLRTSALVAPPSLSRQTARPEVDKLSKRSFILRFVRA